MKKNLYLVAILCLFLLASCGPSIEELRVSALDHFDRGNQHLKGNRFKAAIQEYQTAVQLNPEHEYFYYNMGLAYNSLILTENAISSFRKAIELKPNFAEAWYNLSLMLYKTNDTENAFLAYEKYLKLNKNSSKVKPNPLQNKTKPTVKSP